jgi:hypothetical protein
MKFLTIACIAVSSLLLINCLLKTAAIDTCKNLNIKFDLKKEKFSGTWFPVVVSKNIPLKSDCYSVEVNTVTNDKMLIGIHNRRRGRNETTYVLNAKTENSFEVKHNTINSLVTVLDTDYNTYAILYACTDVLMKRYFVAILSRETTLPDAKIKNLTNYIRNMTRIKNFKNVKQGNETCRPL